jgi:hypothetical protein
VTVDVYKHNCNTLEAHMFLFVNNALICVRARAHRWCVTGAAHSYTS